VSPQPDVVFVPAPLPAKLSIHDPAFRDYADLFPRLEVRVDGVRQTRVIGYDVPDGWVIRHKVDDEGKVVLNDELSATVTEKVFGDVTLAWSPLA